MRQVYRITSAVSLALILLTLGCESSGSGTRKESESTRDFPEFDPSIPWLLPPIEGADSAATSLLGVSEDASVRYFTTLELNGSRAESRAYVYDVPTGTSTRVDRFGVMSSDGNAIAFVEGSGSGSAPEDLQPHVVFLDEDVISVASGALSGLPASYVLEIDDITRDGNLVLFHSRDDYGVSNSTSGHGLFLSNFAEQTTIRLTGSPNDPPNSFPIEGALISSQGRFIAVTTELQLVPDADSDELSDVYILDRDTDTWTLASTEPAPTGDSYFARALSDDGQFVTFDREGRHDAEGVPLASNAVFFRAMAQPYARHLAVAPDGDPPWQYTGGSMSADGRYVVFITDDAAFLPAGSRALPVFISDTVSDSWSLASAGIEGSVYAALISADGEHVVALSGSEPDSGGIFIFPRP